MIPKIIHQTWKEEAIPPGFAAWSKSWRERNPDWRWILWTDRMLLTFAWEHYPELFLAFASYDFGVMRADAGRYMLLHHFGGIYADLDTECLAPLTALESETRVVLCHEPPKHWASPSVQRGYPFLLFNGVMASPAQHPFWRRVLDVLPLTSHASSILDATGPCMLTGAYLDYVAKQEVRVDPCQLFCGWDNAHQPVAPYAPETPQPLARHYWAGTWFDRKARRTKVGSALRMAFFRTRYELTRGKVLEPEAAQRAVDPAAVARPVPAGNKVAILVPVRDAVSHLQPFFDEIERLDYPKDAIKLAFCEGDSRDETWNRLNEIAEKYRSRYRDIVLVRHPVGVRFERSKRWAHKLQRARRAGLAAVRNRLIDVGLDATDDWALWIDVDVWRFPRDIIQQLTAVRARIVAPHCVIVPGGSTFDLNSFVSIPCQPPYRYYKHMHGGLFQPPHPHFDGRLHMDGLRHSARVDLDGVGGTMLLVDASLHRAGLRFPELPYRDHIETEGLGLLARDLGVRPVGLPRVEVMHVPW